MCSEKKSAILNFDDDELRLNFTLVLNLKPVFHQLATKNNHLDSSRSASQVTG